jgi:signal transduction histidine kinase
MQQETYIERDLETKEVVSIGRTKIHELANVLGEILRTNRDYLKLQVHVVEINRVTTAIDAIEVLMLPRARAIMTSLEKLLERQSDGNKFGIQIQQLLSDLSNATASTSIGLATIAKLAQLSHTIVDILKHTKATGEVRFPKEPFKEALAATRELSQLISTYQLSQNLKLVDSAAELLSNYISNPHTSKIEDDWSELSEILHEILSDLRPMYEARNIKFSGPKISQNETRVQLPNSATYSVVRAVLENAIKYTGELPLNSRHTELWITLRIESSDANLVLEVESWGLPITQEEHKERWYFKPGYRGYFAHSTEIKGTGNGLAEAAKLVEKHGGDIALITQPVDKRHNLQKSTTTTLKITLPKVRNEFKT